MTRILVTGATGQLGRPTVAALRDAGADVAGLNRSGTDGAVAADLLTGRGLDAALSGVDTLVHLASSNGKQDVPMAQLLTTAAKRAKVSHVVLISIVGIERFPLRFYRDRLAIEQIMRASGIPVTVQRATQFHSLIERMFAVQKFPLVYAPSWSFQPIAVEDVAQQLSRLAMGEPRGTVADIGGPQQATLPQWFDVWKRIRGVRRAAVTLQLPGKLAAAYASGANLVPGPAFGQRTFDSYVTDLYSAQPDSLV